MAELSFYISQKNNTLYRIDIFSVLFHIVEIREAERKDLLFPSGKVDPVLDEILINAVMGDISLLQESHKTVIPENRPLILVPALPGDHLVSFFRLQGSHAERHQTEEVDGIFRRETIHIHKLISKDHILGGDPALFLTVGPDAGKACHVSRRIHVL